MFATTMGLAQDSTDISWKFEKDKLFFQELKTSTSQVMQVMGQEIAQNQEQMFYFRWTVKDVKDGKITMTQKIEGVKLKMDIAGNVIQFDSNQPFNPANPATSSALSQFFQAMVGAELDITFKQADMTVEKVDRLDDLYKKLAAVNVTMEPLLKKLLTTNSVKQMIDPSFGAVPPGGTLNKGGTWDRASKVDLGPIGSYDNKLIYTYKGDKDDKDKVTISVKSQLKYNLPPGDATGLPFKIIKADLKQDASPSEGTVIFDRAAGRVAESKLGTTLEGSLTISLNGQEQTIPLRQTQTTTIRTADTTLMGKAKS
jgi:hypothetical protein